MDNAYILHGICDEEEYIEMNFPSPSNAHWLPWLQQKFLRNGVLCQCFEMPTPHAPSYKEWEATWKSAQLTSKTNIVAHSAGCGFILKWLSLNPEINLNNLFLVAPWNDPRAREGDFLQCKLDPTLPSRINQIHVFYSLDEKVSGVKEAKDLILATYPDTTLHTFENYGHFTLGHLDSPEFPELWEIIAQANGCSAK